MKQLNLLTGRKPAHKPKPCCPTCGASMMEHRHRMSPGLAGALVALARASGGGIIGLGGVVLTHSQWDNFQKLRYWEVVNHHGSKKSGMWSVSELGRMFIDRRSGLQPIAWTFRGEVVRRGGESTMIDEVLRDTPYWDSYQDYCRGMEAHR